jgi:hypothetical protein
LPFSWPIEHTVSSEAGISSTKLVVKDPQARHVSDPEAATKYPAGTERLFCKHEANSINKIIRQGPTGPGTVK